MLRRALIALNPTSVVHGAADGADTFAGEWARDEGIEEIARPYPDHLGKGGGPLRNAYLLDTFQPDLVLACRTIHGPDAGTLDCIKAAFYRGLVVLQLVDTI